MPFVLYLRSTSRTGRALASALGVPGGTTFPEERVDALIRWGNSNRVRLRPERCLNSREAISRATDKLDSLEILRRGGVRVPTTHPLNQDSVRLFRYPALARTRKHTRGTDIQLCLQPSDAVRALGNGSEYLVEYVPTETEYRVHVFRESVIKTSEKVLTNPEAITPWVRNHGHGYTYRKVRTEPSGVVKAFCVAAVGLLGLDFGAVDVLVSPSGEPWVLEVNTAPGLVTSGIRTYARAIISGLELPTPLPEEVTEEEDETEDGQTEELLEGDTP